MPEQPRRKVFVVDDEPDAVAFIRAVMEDTGYEVDSASNGAECLAKLPLFMPDLVVLDVQMPGEPGFFVLQKIKTAPETKHIPVIMLTGVGERLGISYSNKDLYDFLGHEPDVYLEKPIDPKLLRQSAEKLLSAARGPKPPKT